MRAASVRSLKPVRQRGNCSKCPKKHAERRARYGAMLISAANASQNMSQLPRAGASPARRPTCACGSGCVLSQSRLCRSRCSPKTKHHGAEVQMSHAGLLFLPLKRHFSSHPSLLRLYSSSQTCTNNGASLLAPPQIETVGSQSERANVTCALFLNAEHLLGDRSKCWELDWWRQKQGHLLSRLWGWGLRNNSSF